MIVAWSCRTAPKTLLQVRDELPMLLSIKKNLPGIFLMILCNFFLSVGQLLWKLIPTYGYLMLFVGFAAYGIGALFMLFAYRFGELSVLQPMNCFSYVFMILFAGTILHEFITVKQYLGIALIMMGVVLIGGSKRT